MIEALQVDGRSGVGVYMNLQDFFTLISNFPKNGELAGGEPHASEVHELVATASFPLSRLK